METKKDFIHDYVEDSICEILGISKEEYSNLKLDSAKKALENNKKYKTYYTQTGAFWSCYLHRINFVNLQILVEYQYCNARSLKGSIDVETYLQFITAEFILPKRVINLINKQYRLQFIEINDFKPQKRKYTKRVSKNQESLFKNNLNTI